jgi:hypothetical protein
VHSACCVCCGGSQAPHLHWQYPGAHCCCILAAVVLSALLQSLRRPVAVLLPLGLWLPVGWMPQKLQLAAVQVLQNQVHGREHPLHVHCCSMAGEGHTGVCTAACS